MQEKTGSDKCTLVYLVSLPYRHTCIYSI